MALQSTGAISMGDINVELGRARTSSVVLSAVNQGGYGAINQSSPSRPNATAPHGIGEWYGYNHSAASLTNNNLTALRSSSVGVRFTLQFALSVPLTIYYDTYTNEGGWVSWSIVMPSSSTSVTNSAGFSSAFDTGQTINITSTSPGTASGYSFTYINYP